MQSASEITRPSDIEQLSGRVGKQTTLLAGCTRDVKRLELRTDALVTEFREENKDLKQELAKERARVAKLETVIDDQQKMLAALQGLIPRLSDLEAKVNDPSGKERVEEKLAKLRSDLHETRENVKENASVISSVEQRVDYMTNQLFAQSGKNVQRIESVACDVAELQQEFSYFKQMMGGTPADS